MDTRMKLLIAVGASVTANCIPCVQGLVPRARQAGVDEDDLQMAVAVGRSVQKGAAACWDEEATALIGAVPDQPCLLSSEA
jgi:AhpD family alkylhydroperoxidase